MRSNVIAPWAEPVPGASYPFHVADLATLPDGAWRYEIVEGRLFRMPSDSLDVLDVLTGFTLPVADLFSL